MILLIFFNLLNRAAVYSTVVQSTYSRPTVTYDNDGIFASFPVLL